MSTQGLPNWTAFEGDRRMASGSLAEVALAVKAATEGGGEGILVFSDRSGRVIDIDIQGSEEEVLERLEPIPPAPLHAGVRGRPKLGVVAREVTLLPRHWEWLGSQPGGASVVLRRLVEDARRANGDKDRIRESQEAAYRFMSAMAGNRPGFEEAIRALFAEDRRRFAELVAGWPEDIRDYAIGLAWGTSGGTT